MPHLDGFVLTGFLLVAAIWGGIIAILATVLYQVIWRAVRRGLREYHATERQAP